MNSFQFTGKVKKFGIRGKQFPEMWILIQLPKVKVSPSEEIDGNKVFIHVRLNAGKSCEMLKAKMAEGLNVLVTEAFITDIKRSKKNEDTGEWEEEIVTGIRASASNIHIKDYELPPVNYGTLKCKVIKQRGRQLMLEEQYRFPKKEGGMETGTRNVPVLLEQDPKKDLSGRMLFCVAALCGVTPDGRSKVYAAASPYIEPWN